MIMDEFNEEEEKMILSNATTDFTTIENINLLTEVPSSLCSENVPCLPHLENDLPLVDRENVPCLAHTEGEPSLVKLEEKISYQMPPLAPSDLQDEYYDSRASCSPLERTSSLTELGKDPFQSRELKSASFSNKEEEISEESNVQVSGLSPENITSVTESSINFDSEEFKLSQNCGGSLDNADTADSPEEDKSKEPKTVSDGAAKEVYGHSEISEPFKDNHRCEEVHSCSVEEEVALSENKPRLRNDELLEEINDETISCRINDRSANVKEDLNSEDQTLLSKPEEKEEGELEEGELEEDEEGNNDSEDGVKEQPTWTEAESLNDNQEIENISPTKSEDIDVKKPEKEKTSTKRRNRDGGDDSRKKKKRRHLRHPEELDIKDKEGSTLKHKKSLPKEVSYDYDVLLQHEIEKLVGSDAENLTESEQSKLFKFIKQCRNRDVNSDPPDPVSGDEWEERRQRPRKHRRGSRSPTRGNSEMCIYFLQGYCRRGKLCPFSHDCPPKPKMELCKFYMMDCCAKKAKCLYMHNDFPCKYFHFGMKCEAGDKCKFSHDSLEENTKNILLKHIELAPKDILGNFPRVTPEIGDIIISVTQAKKAGQPIDSSMLEKVREFEGKGLKYLDKAMKHLPKREVEHSASKDERREMEGNERSPWKNRNRDPHSRSNKERDRERFDRERGEKNASERDRYQKRERPRERDRPQQREVDSPFSKRLRRGRHPCELTGKDREDRSYRNSSKPSPLDSSNKEQKWYSSDEDEERYGDLKDYRSSDVPRLKERIGNDPRCQDDLPTSSNDKDFMLQGGLPDIDVMYLKNVLDTVQNHANKDRDELIKDQRNVCTEAADNYSAIANDIKEVFVGLIEGTNIPTRKTLASTPRDLLSESDNFYKEQLPSSSAVSNITSNLDDRPNYIRDDPRMRSSKRYSSCDDQSNQTEKGRYRRSSTEDHENLSASRSVYDDVEGDLKLHSSRHSYDTRTVYDTKTHQDTLRSSSKRSESSKIPQRLLGNDLFADKSIYALQEDSGEEISLPQDFTNEEIALPFKVPIHSSAKEIDASYNPLYAASYRLVQVDIPKPDFSRLKLNREDPKIMDDPRLRRMFHRRSSQETLLSPRSGRYDSDATPASPPYEEKRRAARGPLAPEAENRDPRRKAASRDPRFDSLSNSQIHSVQQDPRPNPRFAQSTIEDEFRIMSRAHSMTDVRPDLHDHRFDPRDNERFEPERRFENLPLPNELLDNNQDFLLPQDVPNMAKPGLHQGMDPRGRPGLLGPGPLPNTISLPNIPIQLSQAVLANPFLLAQNLTNPILPTFSFVPPDRMNNPDMGGHSFDGSDQRNWNARRRDNRDPRFKRD